MRRVVYVLLVTQIVENQVSVSIGHIYWDRIDAHRAAKTGPYAEPSISVQIVEREVRGEEPQMRTSQAG